MDVTTVLKENRQESLKVAERHGATNVRAFGSVARGEADEASDIDLLVVVDESPLTPTQRDTIAYRALGDIPVPIDVQVCTQAEFDKRAGLSVSFERTVKHKGRLVHAA